MNNSEESNFEEVQKEHLRRNLKLTFEEKLTILEEMNEMVDFFKTSKAENRSST